MTRRLLDPVLDPEKLLAELDDLDRQRAARPGDAKPAAAAAYAQITQALTDPELRAHTPVARGTKVPGDDSRPPAEIYMQPHAALSQFQSVISECFEAQLVSAGELEPARHGIWRWVAELIERLRRFGPCDIRWIEPKLLQLASNLAHDKHAFADIRPTTVALAERAKVFIVGDWATALPQARNVARSIHDQLQAAIAGVECHVIHLGDTYYSGTEDEYRERFLPLWPVDRGSPARSWSLNGNHDMYAGGHGYFDVLLRDPRFAAQRGASYFCLGNDHWRIVGLDDSYTDPDTPQLAGSQTQWLAELVDARSGPGTLLLTHHQPFSAWEVVDAPLAREVAQALGQTRVEGWLWGHEHRAAVYEPGIDYGSYHDLAQYTAIVGHGGVPNLVSGPAVTPPAQAVDQSYLRWQNTDCYKIDEDTWSYGGFAVLDLDGDSAQIQFFTELGEPRTGPGGEAVGPDLIARLG